MTIGLLLVALFTVLFCMIANRLASTILTAPMLFLGFGFALSTAGVMATGDAERLLHIVAEVALIVLLFLDAAQIDLTVLRRQHVWPVRMLVIGLPLAIVLGTLCALPFLSDWPLVAVVLVAAILAPTDAALGQAVVTNPLVPERSRRALTVESGLNDGLALPAILLFASLSAEAMEPDQTNWLLFGFLQLTLGPLVGTICGLVGGWILLSAKALKLTAVTYEGIGAIALAAACYLGASQIGGNGFIAAFVGGLAFGNVVQGRCKFVYEFTESEGQMLAWAAFLLIGMVLVPEAIEHLTWAMLAIILGSLFIVRPLAIWLSLAGTDASTPTKLFFGWFGPRGLATALFALLIVKQIDHALAEQVLALAVNAVWISALLHGLSAVPGAKWYAGLIAAQGDCAETMPIQDSAKPLTTHNLVEPDT
ncbi:MAG: cation:proton antiporter [Hyphomicrobiaceae bacterium]